MLRKQIFKDFKSNEEFFENARVAVFIYIFYSDRWKNLEQFIKHMCHLFGFVDLKEKRSEDIDLSDLVRSLEDIIPIKIKKKELLEDVLELSKNSFNKKFKPFLVENNLVGRRAYDIDEINKMISYWYGEGEGNRLKGFGKQELANKVTNGNLKELSKELNLYYEDCKEEMINDDILSPKVVRGFLLHIGYDEDEILKLLLN